MSAINYEQKNVFYGLLDLEGEYSLGEWGIYFIDETLLSLERLFIYFFGEKNEILLISYYVVSIKSLDRESSYFLPSKLLRYP